MRLFQDVRAEGKGQEMGKRLIYADELLQEFEIETVIHRHGELWHITGIKAFIENAPTVDAVEVVRCKDCKHYSRDPWDNEEFICRNWSDWLPTEPDDFCSYGERRSDETD